MSRFWKITACSMVFAIVPYQALADDDDEVTCAYVESKNTYYGEIGSFDELTAACLTTSDGDACCVVTEGESGTCADSAVQSIPVATLLRRVIEKGHAVTFSPHSDEAKRKFYKEKDIGLTGRKGKKTGDQPHLSGPV